MLNVHQAAEQGTQLQDEETINEMLAVDLSSGFIWGELNDQVNRWIERINEYGITKWVLYLSALEEGDRLDLNRIQRELRELNNKADFPVKFLPVAAIKGAGDIPGINDLDSADVITVYPAGGGQDTFAKLAERGKDMIFFCRHKSGPVYLWYEIISPRYLRQHTDKLALKGIDDTDVVVDSQDDGVHP